MKKISIIGMGYIGLPLAKALQKYFLVTGYDNSVTRINELNKAYDRNNHFTKKQLLLSKNLFFSNQQNDLNNTKIKNKLNYKPKVDVEIGVKNFIDWCRSYYKK